jgi:hypothetical protein
MELIYLIYCSLYHFVEICRKEFTWLGAVTYLSIIVQWKFFFSLVALKKMSTH